MGVLLVINADDLGYSRQRTAGIFRCSRACGGVVTAASLLANGVSAEAAIDQFKQFPADVALGLHVNVTEGKPISPPDRVHSLLRDGLFLGKMGFREALAAGNVNLDEVSIAS